MGDFLFIVIIGYVFLRLSCLANCLLSLYKHCKELSQRSVSSYISPDIWQDPHFLCWQASFFVPVDLSQFLDTHPTGLPHPPSSPAGRGSGEGGGVQGATEGGRGRSSGEEGKAMITRRETKRKLWEDLEPFSPKRRSSRVSGYTGS